LEVAMSAYEYPASSVRARFEPETARPSDLPTELKTALLKVLGHSSPASAVSTREAIASVRELLPHLDIPDDTLANMVADQAVVIGRSITFDSRKR
jgi:hypothetical protein